MSDREISLDFAKATLVELYNVLFPIISNGQMRENLAHKVLFYKCEWTEKMCLLFLVSIWDLKTAWKDFSNTFFALGPVYSREISINITSCPWYRDTLHWQVTEYQHSLNVDRTLEIPKTTCFAEGLIEGFRYGLWTLTVLNWRDDMLTLKDICLTQWFIQLNRCYPKNKQNIKSFKQSDQRLLPISVD